MTFTELVAELQDRLNLRSPDSATRLGRLINARYKRVTSAIGLQTSRRAVSVSGSTAIGYATVTFTGIEKIDRIIDATSGTNRTISQLTFDEMRDKNPRSSDVPQAFCIQSTGPTSVTILLDSVAQSIYTLNADGLTTASTLSGTDVPQFPEDFHDILVFGVLADEYRKAEKIALARDSEENFERRLSDLRMFIAKSGYLDIKQGKVMPNTSFLNNGGGGGSGSAPSGGTSYVQTGLITFDRDPSAPFAVTSGSAKVDNLDADLLDGLDSTAFIQAAVSTDNAIARFDGVAGQIQDSGITIADGAAGTLAGSNSGDVTLAGTPNYLTIAGQVITRALINLASHVTGRLPFANLTAATAASKLFGRGDASAGDMQEITLGTGLSMSGTTLNASSTGTLKQTFRGLHLRSHPDSDVALSKVMMIHADEVVMSDGTSVTSGLDSLIANMTVTGAGGLSSFDATEQASTWYQVHVIRKSSDATTNLLLHRAKDWTLDTSFTTAPDISRALRLSTSTATDKLAQGIQFANSKPFQFVDIALIKNGAPTGNIWLTIESDSAGSPSGTVLATSDKMDVSKFSASAAQIARFIFRTPATVTATTQYHLVLQGDYTRNDAVSINWRGLIAGGYASGSAKQFNGAAWSAATGVGDFYFIAYTEQHSDVVGSYLPTGYDQYCQIGWCYNNSSSNIVPFTAKDRRVSMHRSETIASVTATVATLADLSAFFPPCQLAIEITPTVSVAGGQCIISPVPDGYGSQNTPSDPGMFGSRNYTSGATTDKASAGELITNYQAVYAMVTAGSYRVYMPSFTW